MNGRIYDPLLGRFLSADVLVQSPNRLQSYNRYTYVMNNPLRLTDPTGYSWVDELTKKPKPEKETIWNRHRPNELDPRWIPALYAPENAKSESPSTPAETDVGSETPTPSGTGELNDEVPSKEPSARSKKDAPYKDQFHYKLKYRDADGELHTVSKFAGGPSELYKKIRLLRLDGSKIEFLRVGAHHNGATIYGADRTMDVESADLVALLTEKVVSPDAYISLDMCFGTYCIDDLRSNLSFNGSNVTIDYTDGINTSFPGTSLYIRYYPGKGTTYRTTRLGDLGWINQKLH